MKKYTDWKICYSIDNKKYSEYFDALVPGACQLDYAKYKNLPDYKLYDNALLFDGLENNYWKYSTIVPKTSKKLFFISKGIDYEFDIFIDGEKVLYQEGMFSEVKLLIPKEKEGKELNVVVYPSPKRVDAEKGTRREADRCFKPGVCYGWDFHPRLITQGIWDDTYFLEKEDSYINDFLVTYELDDNYKNANVNIEYDVVCGENNNILLNVYSPKGDLVYSSILDSKTNTHSFNLDGVLLWWCHNYGDQNLYSFELVIKDKNDNVFDKVKKEIGFRRVKLISTKYSFKYWKLPFTEAFVPITMELNGVVIFCKGSNFVSPEIFNGLIDYDRYKELILALKEMNGNIIRVWGGAIVCKDSFYEICDKEGILVWQEFPLSCNSYKDNDKYLQVARTEASNIIKRLREHPSLSIWCGGNELYIGAENNPQYHIIRLLNSLCFELDKNTPWLDTTPMYGMRHGHYSFLDFYGNECIKLFQKAKATAYTEFGCPSLAPYETLKQIIPEDKFSLEDLLNKDINWVIHHAIDTWDGESWLRNSNLEHYYGKTKDIKDAVVKSQLLESMGYKALFEEARRQKNNCSMVLNWCFNEPYPNAGNNCLVCYPLVKKPAYYAVKESLKDKVLSLRFTKFSFVEGETFKYSLWLLNDGPKKAIVNNCKVTLILNDKEYVIGSWDIKQTKVDTNKKSNNFSFALPSSNTCIMKIKLECDNQALNNEYDFIYYSKKDYDLLKDKTNTIEFKNL